MKNRICTLDEFINESNEVLKAQDACKAAMFQIQKPFEKILAEVKNRGILESFSTKIVPYNNGYMLETTTKFPVGFFSKAKDDTSGLSELFYGYISSVSTIHVQPSSWFSADEFADGSAKIEGQSFPMPKDKSYKPFRQKVSSKDEIKKVLKQYLDENLAALDELSKLLK